MPPGTTAGVGSGGDRGRRPSGRGRRGSDRRRGRHHGIGVGDVERWESRASRCGANDQGSIRQRAGEPVLGVGTKPVRDADRADLSLDGADRNAGSTHHDLAPTDSLRERAVGEGELDATGIDRAGRATLRRRRPGASWPSRRRRAGTTVRLRPAAARADDRRPSARSTGRWCRRRPVGLRRSPRRRANRRHRGRSPGEPGRSGSRPGRSRRRGRRDRPRRGPPRSG